MWGHPTPRQGAAAPWNPATFDLRKALKSVRSSVLIPGLLQQVTSLTTYPFYSEELIALDDRDEPIELASIRQIWKGWT